jgi:hypothetical protein
MQTSASINELLPALCQARAVFGPIPKNQTAKVRSDKGNYEFTYADLGAILETVTPPLTAHGLLLLFGLQESDGTLEVSSRLYHCASSQYLENTLSAPKPSGATAMGSLITYLRRYTSCPLLGVCAEDDDDASAVEGHAITLQASTPTPVQAPRPLAHKTANAVSAKALRISEISTTLLGFIPNRQPDAFTRRKTLTMDCFGCVWSEMTKLERPALEAGYAHLKEIIAAAHAPTEEPTPADEGCSQEVPDGTPAASDDVDVSEAVSTPAPDDHADTGDAKGQGQDWQPYATAAEVFHLKQLARRLDPKALSDVEDIIAKSGKAGLPIGTLTLVRDRLQTRLEAQSNGKAPLLAAV